MENREEAGLNTRQCITASQPNCCWRVFNVQLKIKFDTMLNIVMYRTTDYRRMPLSSHIFKENKFDFNIKQPSSTRSVCKVIVFFLFFFFTNEPWCISPVTKSPWESCAVKFHRLHSLLLLLFFYLWKVVQACHQWMCIFKSKVTDFPETFGRCERSVCVLARASCSVTGEIHSVSDLRRSSPFVCLSVWLLEAQTWLAQ